ncbi:conserved hypothetical protein [delta proteobacterium NaphS2]|nr:conserved hypothetical protein [delta proteobacterium NaphS2]
MTEPLSPTHTEKKKRRCSDCLQCQGCSETRCRICRKSTHETSVSGLGSGFTHGEYLAWKKNIRKQHRGFPSAARENQKP